MCLSRLWCRTQGFKHGLHFWLEVLTGAVELGLRDSDPAGHYQLFTRIMYHCAFSSWSDVSEQMLAACALHNELRGRWHAELTAIRGASTYFKIYRPIVNKRILPQDEEDFRFATIFEEFLQIIRSSNPPVTAFVHKTPNLPSEMSVRVEAPLALRHLGTGGVQDYSVGSITLSPVAEDELPGAAFAHSELQASGEQPLAQHVPLAEIFVHTTADADARLDGSAMPCAHPALLSHAQAQTELAQDTLRRLRDDWAGYAKQHNVETHVQLAEDFRSAPALLKLRGALWERLAAECTATRTATRAVLRHVQLVSGGDDPEREAERLLQFTGQAPRARWESLVAALLSSTGDEEIRQTNRHLSDADVELALRVTAGILQRTCRIAQLRRALHSVHSTISTMADTSGAPVQRAIAMRNEVASLAAQLEARRHYVTAELQLDPRMLAFEYLFGWLLRKGQVELIATLHERATGADRHSRDGAPCTSMAHQMIMGGGKSTCIAPMLALLLADGTSLITQVVPTALLYMSREVMWSRFAQVLVKTVHTFNFSRAANRVTGEFVVDPTLFLKLDEARRTGGVVVTTPVAIKSLVNKFVELLYTLHLQTAPSQAKPTTDGLRAPVGDNKDKAPAEVTMKQADALAQIMELWGAREGGVLLIDEVDLLLHPLRSELNFPLGARDHPLTPEPTRRELPIYLLERLLTALEAIGTQALRGGTTSRRGVSTGGLNPLDKDLCTCISDGLADERLLGQSHLIVADRSFYMLRMLPLLAQMAAEHLVDTGVFGKATQPPPEVLLEFLVSGLHASKATCKAVQGTGPQSVQCLNHAHELLTGTLPHVLSRVHRVAFGVLRPEEMRDDEPALRRLMAVPFVGKDRPSLAAEFAQPDVMICSTVLGYMYEGLRYADLQQMARQMSQELHASSRAPSDHTYHRLFEGWVSSAMAEQQLTTRPVATLALLLPSERAQMEALHALLRRHRPTIAHYMRMHVLTPTNLQAQRYKISSSGQELGGDILFGRRIGFSGTPSNLLPLDLYPCRFEQGSEGRILHTLTDPKVTTMCVLNDEADDEGGGGGFDDGEDGLQVGGVGSGGGASYARWLLSRIANAQPPYDALVDTGALITGLSNEEVASFLVERLDPFLMDAVLFLDADGRKMALVRGNATAVPLSECTFPIERRFTFYDQINTTGMDIRHRTSAAALITVSKDMVYRDLAQGAYRMRGIGDGQTVELLLGPGVQRMVEEELTELYVAEGKQYTPTLVVAWLLLRTFRTEETQYRQLSAQNVESVCRRSALEALLASSGAYMRGAEGVPMQQRCASLFVQADVDGNGTLDKTEVLALFGKMRDELQAQRKAAQAKTEGAARAVKATRAAAAKPAKGIMAMAAKAIGLRVTRPPKASVASERAAATSEVEGHRDTVTLSFDETEVPSDVKLMKIFDACDVDGRGALNVYGWQAFVRSALQPPKVPPPITHQGVTRFTKGRHSSHLRACLDCLVVEDTKRASVPTTVAPSPALSVELRRALKEHTPLVDEAGRAVCESILQRLEQLETDGGGGEEGSGRRALDQEMSREREKDVVKEKDRELVVHNVYHKPVERQAPWALSLLRDASLALDPRTAMLDGGFYPLRNFSPRPGALKVSALEDGSIGTQTVPAVPPLHAFPTTLLQSSNVVRQTEDAFRRKLCRLRKVVFVVEVLRPNGERAPTGEGATIEAAATGAAATGAATTGAARSCWLIVTIAEAAAIRAYAHAPCLEGETSASFALVHVPSGKVLESTPEYREQVRALSAAGKAHVAAGGGVLELVHFYNGNFDLGPPARTARSHVLPGQLPALALLSHLGESSCEERRRYMQALQLSRPRRAERLLHGTAMALALELQTAQQLRMVCDTLVTLRGALRAKGQSPRELAAELDADGNRLLSAKELLKPLQQLVGPSVDVALLQSLVRVMDADGSGCVDFDEWDSIFTGTEAIGDEEDEADEEAPQQAQACLSTAYV